MKILIGGVDYTSALESGSALSVRRRINEPSISKFAIVLGCNSTLSVPEQYQYVKIKSDSELLLFTGYIISLPCAEYLGEYHCGSLFSYHYECMSDEFLWDLTLLSVGSFRVTADLATYLKQVLAKVTSRASLLSSLSQSVQVNNVAHSRAQRWSQSVGEMSSSGRSAYMVLNKSTTLQSIGDVVHSFSCASGDMKLRYAEYGSGLSRLLANDITVYGKHEPGAFITEYFHGDGATTDYYLTEVPFFSADSDTVLAKDLFDDLSVSEVNWNNVGGASIFTVSEGGLTVNGGTGVDGASTCVWNSTIEMGGTLMLEARGVKISSGSAGVIAGFYTGLLTQDTCTAGFKVVTESGSGTVTIQPFVGGCAAGVSYTIKTTSGYNLRIRIHSSEDERYQSIYRSYGDDGVVSFGGDVISTSGRVQMEIQSVSGDVEAVPVVLYDGSVSVLPQFCELVAFSSIDMVCSMRSLTLRSLGDIWVSSIPSGGGIASRRPGFIAGEADCHLQRSGKLVFYTGYEPASGELVVVNYRTIRRASGRAVNTSSQAALAKAGSPSVQAWIGSVTNPEARSSADCRSAAQALLAAASSVSALWKGSLKVGSEVVSEDIAPGDVVQITDYPGQTNLQMIVREVTITSTTNVPERYMYSIECANEWAEDLSITTSKTVPDDATFPVKASPTFVASLSGMSVNSVDGTTISLSMGVTAPSGGGFEVRRVDNSFHAGSDSDLVMRTSVSNLTIAREAQVEQFYVRMFDASTPPNYSEFSSAIFVDLPLG